MISSVNGLFGSAVIDFMASAPPQATLMSAESDSIF